MFKRAGLTILFVIPFIILLLIPLTLAQNEPANVILTFVDAVSKEPISDVFVKVNLNDKENSYFIEKDETLKLYLKQDNYRLKLLINNPETKGYDYFGETLLSVENNVIKVIYLYPVGSLNGFVKDKLDTAIAEADLKFDCSKAFDPGFPEMADRFGSFSLDYVPVGNCTIYGSYEESLGVEEIEIIQGTKNFVEIKLDDALIMPRKDSFLPMLSVLIVILLLSGALIYYFKTKIKSFTKKEKQEEKEIKVLKKDVEEIKSLEDLSKREKDIFKTLRDNEKKIVEFLVQQKGPVYFSKIHYKTGLSKSSLFRNLKSLENKNIVETSKEGKIRKIELSPWFLGK